MTPGATARANGKPAAGELPEVLRRIAISGYEASRAVLAEPVPWIWGHIVASTHAVEVCGGTGSGKTTLAALLVAARANTGAPVRVLGHEVEPAPAGKKILAVLEENAKQSSVAQIDRACEVLGLDPRATWSRIVLLARAGVRARWLSSDDAEAVAALRNPRDAWTAILATAQAGVWGLIVLDTRAKILGGFGASKDEESQAEAARIVTSLVEAAGCAVLVLSHERKGGAAGGDDLDAVSGSVQRAGGADVVLVVRAERERGRVMASTVTLAKQRDDLGGEWPEPMTFALARKGDAWTLADGAAPGDDARAHERVHALLSAEGEMTARQVRDALGMSNKRAAEALGVLVAGGDAKKRTTLQRGKHVVVFGAKPRWSDLGPKAGGE